MTLLINRDSGLPGRLTRAFRGIRRLLTLPRELRNIGSQLSTLSNDIETVHHRICEADDRLRDLSQLISDSGVSLKNQLDAISDAVRHLTAGQALRMNALDNVTEEIKNRVIHLDTSLHSRLNSIDYETLIGICEQMHELAAAQFKVRAQALADPANWKPFDAEQYRAAAPESLESFLDRAETEFARVFPLWKQRLDTLLEAFHETKVGNAARAGDSRSEVFRSFVEIHASGRVLDVGCGVFGRPHYLTSYPRELVSGLDPLQPLEPPDFELVRGISEYLPWPSGSFTTVISATSLDHCLSLDRSLAEIRRVLRPSGKFLLWIDSVPGSAAYDPEAPDFVPVDRFHLFHFDAKWLEPMLDRWFDLVDRIELRRPDFSRVMYCLVRKSASNSDGTADGPAW